jgi:hypothetical protein
MIIKCYSVHDALISGLVFLTRPRYVAEISTRVRVEISCAYSGAIRLESNIEMKIERAENSERISLQADILSSSSDS